MGDNVHTGILLLGSHAGERLEPVAEVGDSQTLGPLHHRQRDHISGLGVQLDVGALPGVQHLLVAACEYREGSAYAYLGTDFWSMSSLKAYFPKTSSIRTDDDEEAKQRTMAEGI